MSYTSILSIKFSKQMEELVELRNSWGSAPYIWDQLCQKYFGAEPFGWSSKVNQLWPLYKDAKLPRHHRAVLMMTYDQAYVSKKNFKRAASDIREFLKDFPPNPNHVNHWQAIAETYENANCSNIGIHHTSVSENPFLQKGKVMRKSDCFEIYEELEG